MSADDVRKKSEGTKTLKGQSQLEDFLWEVFKAAR